jgi:protein disulfide-isomerase A1
VDEAKELKESADVVVFGFFSDAESDAAKEFVKAAEKFDDLPFGITTSSDVKSEFGVSKDGVVVFQKFDEGRADYEGESKAEDIVAFVQANSLPLLVEFTHTTAQKIFGGDAKSHAIFFLSKDSDKYAEQSAAATKVAKDFKGKILFVVVNTDEEEHVRILEFFGMTQEDVPAMRIIQLKEEMTKYKPESSDLSEDTIRKFANDFLEGNLKQHLLTQALPEDWNKNSVWVLTGSNFDEVALDKSKDVLVEFYAPWCGHCKQLAPIYEQLGDKFKDREDIVIAKMDSTANELEHTKIQSFPTIKLYKRDGEVVDYTGPRTLESLSIFVESAGQKTEAPKEDTEENEEDVPSKDEL